MTEPLTVSIEEAAKLLGIGRNLAYEAAHSGEIPSVRVGQRLLVPLAALKRKIEQAASQSEAAAE